MTTPAQPFGVTAGGEEVSVVTLDNGVLSCQILTYGAILRTLWVPDRTGERRDVVLGYDNLAAYERCSAYFGATVGRCANRIARGQFALNGTTYSLARNNGNHHLHGGEKGFTHRLWQIARREEALVELTRVSPDGEDGYPGALQVSVTYSLVDTTLRIRYRARAEGDTLCNLTNHSYFNLSGHNSGSVLEQTLCICADRYTPSDPESIPLGTLESVAGTPMDFTQAHPIGLHIARPFPQLLQGQGYDHNYEIRGRSGVLREAAHACSPESGICMTARTTTPGMHFYTANFVSPGCTGKSGSTYGPRHGFCLEMQHFPDAVNRPAFASPVLRCGEVYDHTTEFSFSCK